MHTDDAELLGLIPRERISKFEIPRPSGDVIQAFLQLPDMAGLVSRVMDRLGIMGSIPAHVLTPLLPGKRVVGPAITIRNVPSRIVPLYGWRECKDTQLGEREAYFIAKQGDVIVIDSGGRMICSNLGPNSAAMANSRGIIGAIIDGPVTGVDGIRKVGFSVWCRGGTTSTGHHRVDTIEINGTVSCVCVQIEPGDLIVADDSGISVVPQNSIERVLEISLVLAKKGQALKRVIEEKGSTLEIRKAFKELIATRQDNH